MTYETELIKKIKNPGYWPDFERPNFLSDLDGIAEDAFMYDTLYGYLSALLIFHQLTEVVIENTLENIQFFIQLSIFPIQIRFPKNKSRMFGELLKELETTIEFKEKETILNKAREINNLRIQLVHKLTKKTSLDDIKPQAEMVKDLFNEIFDLCHKADDRLRRRFSDFKNEVNWDGFLEKDS